MRPFVMRQQATAVLMGAIALSLSVVGCSSSQPHTQSVVRSPEALSIESEARSAIDSMLFDQQTYFMENSSFAVSAKELKTALLTETKNYRYEFAPNPSIRKGVMITATSKNSDLRSYTGVVFAIQSGKEKLMVSQVCETKAPSTIAPSTPTKPSRPSDPLACPAGSHAAHEAIALQP